MVRRTRGSGRGGPARQTDKPRQGRPGPPWENAPASSPGAPGPPPAGPGTRQVDGPVTVSYSSLASCCVHCVLLRPLRLIASLGSIVSLASPCTLRTLSTQRTQQTRWTSVSCRSRDGLQDVSERAERPPAHLPERLCFAMPLRIPQRCEEVTPLLTGQRDPPPVPIIFALDHAGLRQNVEPDPDRPRRNPLALERGAGPVVRPGGHPCPLDLRPHDPVDRRQHVTVRVALRERRGHRWQIFPPI